MVGYDTDDDAAVYRVSESLAVIQTVDFFPPMVDDPYTFGQIAAVNALSDVYAMGGYPVTAMNLLCFPKCTDLEIVKEILAGGHDKVREAGAVLCGGHTIEDDSLKYGLSVNGHVHPEKILTNSGAKQGDILILTKPLGTGIINLAAKSGELNSSDYKFALEIMTTLNKNAAESMQKNKPNACTDITGFGFLGHAYEMAAGSGCTFEMYTGNIPVIHSALDFAKQGYVPAGAYANNAYLKEYVDWGRVSADMADVLCDPQTSGGLLISVPENRAKDLLTQLKEACICAEPVGQVVPKAEKHIILR